MTDLVTKHGHRGAWGSNLQFMLTCIGYAIGLGNIWRFPGLAYENGGGAFLVPYLICSFFFGLPMIYMELSLGQFSRSGPGVVFGRLMPASQGVGWGMITVITLIALYYNVIIAWVLIYLFIIVTGNSNFWSTCTNEWNTISCTSSLEDDRCSLKLLGTEGGAQFFNGSCIITNGTRLNVTEILKSLNATPSSPAEEFFEGYVLEMSNGITDFVGFNVRVTIALALAWSITALCLARGVKWIGRISLFTATFPYIIIVIMFIRSISLVGARSGIDYYLLKPDFTSIFNPQTWRNAATQVCYSMSVGLGAILSLSSYNSFSHNCFKDAVIISACDSFMSVFGGVVVFSVLGFLAESMDREITDVVQSGTGLAFVAYPEAMSRMPLPWLWSLLFFVMLFILGISSQFGLSEVMCTAICDICPRLRRYRHYVVFCVCGSLFAIGLIMCTHAGIYYFQLIDTYCASFSLMVIILGELLVVAYYYGVSNFIEDIRMMIGYPKNRFSAIFGPSGYYLRIIWLFFAPFLVSVILVFALKEQIEFKLTRGRGFRTYVYPEWASLIGWFLSCLSLMCIPVFLYYNYNKLRQTKRNWKELFRVQKKWPSYNRINSGKMGENKMSSLRRDEICPSDLKAEEAWQMPAEVFRHVEELNTDLSNSKF
ncbi:hypothetical protein AB6A40_001947 [Gnathostoma spinigerum]|uniref:Uncharacterized protein n=1 Tax=Gnathostoma spinigerum TaxID=75299 RepID=A0ABD6EEE5_9BILA